MTYLRFDLARLAGKTVTAANLHVQTTPSSASGSPGPDLVEVVADTAWTEAGLDFNSRPAVGAQIGRVGATTSDTGFDIDLASTSQIQAAAGELFSPAIDPVSSDAFYINSRETTTGAKLVVTVQ